MECMRNEKETISIFRNGILHFFFLFAKRNGIDRISLHLGNRPANHSTRLGKKLNDFITDETRVIFTLACEDRAQAKKKRWNKKTINDIIVIRNKHAT